MLPPALLDALRGGEAHLRVLLPQALHAVGRFAEAALGLVLRHAAASVSFSCASMIRTSWLRRSAPPLRVFIPIAASSRVIA